MIGKLEQIWGVTGLVAVLLLSGCKPAGDAIKIGEFASLTGKEATFGISSHEGTLLAVEEINAGGGLLGKRIELLTEDDLSKAGEPATVVNKLISRDGVVAILGEVASSRSLEAAPICQQARVPMISPSSTNPKVTETGDFIFRVCFIDPFQGTVMANFAAKTLKAKKVAVFTDVKSDYSKGLAKYFKEGFIAGGGQIITELDFNGGDKDFKAQLTAIKSANPDAVFVPGYYTDAALICIQAKQLGLKVPLFGGDGWESDQLVKIGQDAVEGHYFSTHYAPDVATDKSKKFVADYQKRFNGKLPDAMAALGYDSAMFLADAMRKVIPRRGQLLDLPSYSGFMEKNDKDKDGKLAPGEIPDGQLKDAFDALDANRDGILSAEEFAGAPVLFRQAVRDALAATKDFDGVTGKTAINAQRDAVKSAVILQVKGGKFHYVETVNP